MSSRRGITLVELIITITVMTLILGAVLPLFIGTQRGYTALEVNSVLPAATQEALNRIQHRLVENKRIFGDNTIGRDFLARVTPSLPVAPMTGSRLPLVVSTGSVSPGAPAFSAGNVGNSLLFLSVAAPLEMNDIDIGAGSTTSVRMDTYLFNYYYLALSPTEMIGSVQGRDLWGWHSVVYADYLQLSAIGNATKRASVVTALNGRGVLFAVDSSVNDVNTAFYELTPGGVINALPSHTVPGNTGDFPPKKMISLIKGVASGGFKFSVSPNTAGGFTHRFAVPGYGAASGDFPSGFEVMAVGSSAGRQVFIRLVMAAQGNFKGFRSYENVLLSTARDLW